MLYFVGGVSRAGKSTFARSLSSQKNALSLSGDPFRILARSHCTRDDFSPLLWRKLEGLERPVDYIRYFVNHTPQAIENMRQEAGALWKLYQTYIEAHTIESTDPLIIESVDIHPEYISELGVPHCAVFFVDTSIESQSDRILGHLYSDPHDWMQRKRFTVDQIKEWVQFNARRSRYILQQAKIYNYPCYDIGTIGYMNAQNEAAMFIESRK